MMDWKVELLQKVIAEEEKKQRAREYVEKGNDAVITFWKLILEEASNLRNLDDRIKLNLDPIKDVMTQKIIRVLYWDREPNAKSRGLCLYEGSSEGYKITRKIGNCKAFEIRWIPQVDALCMINCLNTPDDRLIPIQSTDCSFLGRVVQPEDAEIILRNYLMDYPPFKDLECDLVMQGYAWRKLKDVEREQEERKAQSSLRIFTIFGR